jgi:predicted Fe-Mo cluster-binding NifX family protein
MLDEYEAIRLIDHQKMTQEECAEAMGVSRATVTSIYESARAKLADALISGKQLRISGGAYRIDDVPAAAEVPEKEPGAARVAVPYNDGQVGQHFGRAEQFAFYDVADGAIRRSRVVETGGVSRIALVGFLRAAEVDTLLCGGIGENARNALCATGIRMASGLTGAVEDVVQSYLNEVIKSN